MLRSVDQGTHLSLQDEMGVFREFEPPEQEHSSHLDSIPEEGSRAEELEETELVAALRAEVAQLKSELESQKVKTRNMSRQNCEQIADMDGALREGRGDQQPEGGVGPTSQIQSQPWVRSLGGVGAWRVGEGRTACWSFLCAPGECYTSGRLHRGGP